MVSSDESVRFVGENRPDEDLSEATSKRANFQLVKPWSGRRRSLRQAVAYFCRIIDEREEEEWVMRERSPLLVKRKGWSWT
ncbi:UNVERIFIED_CONTAM: hypothetical protein Sradi_2342500 [Sesamum radiatum]|uniref:Uncharacterized protein n=1 Tax=Sesamum radiatum TaxID=300843 RepID=A0AAW2T5U5_SESRA